MQLHYGSHDLDKALDIYLAEEWAYDTYAIGVVVRNVTGSTVWGSLSFGVASETWYWHDFNAPLDAMPVPVTRAGIADLLAVVDRARNERN
jgi:hypothetical protein